MAEKSEVHLWLKSLSPGMRLERPTTVAECIARLAQINSVKHCLDKTSLLTVINALVSSKL